MSFQPLHFYDAPGALVNQLFNDQLTLNSVKNTLLSPDRLSLTERETLAQRVKASIGIKEEDSSISGRVGNAIVNVVTNPFAWLFFLTSPMGTAALSEGKSAMMAAAKNSAWAQKTAGFFQAAGLLGLDVAAEGTAIPAAVQQINRGINSAEEEVRRELGRPLRSFMEQHGLPSLDPQHPQVVQNPEIARKVRAINYAIMADRSGFDTVGGLTQPTTNISLRVYRVLPGVIDKETGLTKMFPLKGAFEEQEATLRIAERKNGQLRRRVEKLQESLKDAGADAKAGIQEEIAALQAKMKSQRYVAIPSIVSGEPGMERKINFGLNPEWKERYFQEFPGLKDLSERLGRIADRRMADVMKTGGAFDPDKIMRLVSEMRAGGASNLSAVERLAIPENISRQGRKGLSDLLSEPVLDAVRLGAISEKQYADIVMKAMTSSIRQDGKYLPFNVLSQIEQPGMMTKAVKGASPTSLMGNQVRDATGPFTPVTQKEVVFHDDFHKMLEEIAAENMESGGAEALQMIGRSRDRTARFLEKRQAKYATRGQPVFALDPSNVFEVFDRHFAGTGQVKAMLQEADPATLQAMQKSRENMATLGLEAGPVHRMRVGYEKNLVPADVPLDQIPVEWRPMGGYTVMDVLRTQRDMLPNDSLRRQVDATMGVITHSMQQEHSMLLAGFEGMRGMVRSFAMSPVGKAMEGTGLQPLRDALMRFSDPEVRGPSLGTTSGRLASYFYTTHFGINPGPVLVNAMQPIVTGVPMFGFKNTFGAYADALGETTDYLQRRVAKYGLRPISHEERVPLLREAFKSADRMGLKVDFMHELDASVYNGNKVLPGGVLDDVQSSLLKGFEMSERFSRAVAAHTMERAYAQSGRPITEGAKREIEKYVNTTQFTSDPVSTPLIFQKGPLANPLLKQFMSFPLRAFTAIAYQFPRMAEEPSYWKGLGKFLLRGVGGSAILYEAGKGLLGADLSKGLFVDSATAVVGGDRFFQDGNKWIPIPPVISVPKDIITGLATEDKYLLGSGIARSIPGGVALSKVLGVAPPVGDVPLLGQMQKTYAGWDQVQPDGRVPVFNWRGELVDYQPGTALLMKGLGVDLGTGQRGSELDRYLVQQREEILKYRQDYVRRAMGGDLKGAQEVANEFGRRFKDPITKQPLKLTVTKQQIQGYAKNQQTTRPERVFNRLPADMRSQYADALGGQEGRMGPGQPQPQKLDPKLVQEVTERVRRELGMGPAASTHAGVAFPLIDAGFDMLPFLLR